MTLAISTIPSVSPKPRDTPAPVAEALGPRRFTREEYYQMADMGFFQDRHVELIDGEILTMSPQSNAHVIVLSRCVRALDRAFGDGFLVRSQANLRLGNSDPEPDLAVVPIQAAKGQLPPDSALLIVEISLTSLAYDRGDKASLYAAAGIADYWIVNLTNHTVEVRRQPLADTAARFGRSYGQVTTLAAPATVSPLALPDAAITVADFFA